MKYLYTYDSSQLSSNQIKAIPAEYLESILPLEEGGDDQEERLALMQAEYKRRMEKRQRQTLLNEAAQHKSRYRQVELIKEKLVQKDDDLTEAELIEEGK